MHGSFRIIIGCHHKYKLFDDLHAKLFGRQEVNAERIIALWEINVAVRKRLESIEDRLFASYSLTPFLFLFLLREVLELPESGGQTLCQNPSTYLNEPNGLKRLNYTIASIVGAIANMVEADLKRRKAEGLEFDYKKDLKNANKIREIRSQIIPLYQMAVNSKFARPFSKAWKESESELLLES